MEEDEKIEIYLKGYEEGKKEAWSNVKSLANRYEGWELKTRIESKLGTLYQDIDSKRVEVRDDPEIFSFVDEKKVETEEPEEDVKEVVYDTILEELQPGDSCLIFENDPERGFQEIKNADDNGKDCLCISRMYPDKIIRRYDLSDDVNYVLLSKSRYRSDKSDGIKVQTNSPGNLSSLSSKIGNFFKNHEDVVLFMTGLTFMFSYNDFNKIHKFINWTKGKVYENDGNLIISLPRSGFKDEYLLKLKGEFERVVE